MSERLTLPRHRLVNFRLTDEEYAQLRSASVAHGARGLSEFARATLLAKLTPQETSLEVALGRLTEAINKLTAICPDTPGNPCEPKAS